ncbi:MAG TPA: hypothetical protein VLK84_02365 [Longimicrobium sp.]|nr:hypothetical protein [Longimicrobium sp.]
MILPAATVLAGLVALVTFLRSEAGRERRRGMKITTVLALLFAVGGVLLLGLPGAILYELCVLWVRLMQGARFAELGDVAWPAAIVITLTWAASLVIAYALANGPLRRRGRLLRWMVMIVVPYAFGVALAAWAHLSA